MQLLQIFNGYERRQGAQCLRIAKAAPTDGMRVRRKGFLKFVRWRKELRSVILQISLSEWLVDLTLVVHERDR